jgi:MoaA/NifB/PqqE/SkfB family radical SAM enzyme
MGLHIPGWNDATYRRYIAKALLEFKPHSHSASKIELAYLAITKKCPLQCEHCSAADTLNMRDEVSAEQYEYLLEQLHAQGVFQVNFTGGEPLLKFDLLERLVSGVPVEIKTWVNTSGYCLSPEKASRLKAAGLTGVAISLDHYLEEEHNRFRHHEHAYSWALQAVRNAREAGMVVALSVCLSEELCNEQELMRYMGLARQQGVHFVQFLEPKAAGYYKHKDVSLSSEAKRSLEAFFLKMNFGREKTSYPLISYHGYYERRVGCFGAGKKGIYIDADGQLNACPFCHTGYGNLLEGNWDEKLNAMVRKGCTAVPV